MIIDKTDKTRNPRNYINEWNLQLYECTLIGVEIWGIDFISIMFLSSVEHTQLKPWPVQKADITFFGWGGEEMKSNYFISKTTFATRWNEFIEK